MLSSLVIYLVLIEAVDDLEHIKSIMVSEHLGIRVLPMWPPKGIIVSTYYYYYYSYYFLKGVVLHFKLLSSGHQLSSRKPVYLGPHCYFRKLQKIKESHLILNIISPFSFLLLKPILQYSPASQQLDFYQSASIRLDANSILIFNTGLHLLVLTFLMCFPELTLSLPRSLFYEAKIINL